MAEKKNEVVQQEQKTFSVVLAEKLDEVGEACPPDLNKPLFVQNAIALMDEHPELKGYGANQVMNGLMKGAFLNLNFMSSECYLVPYKGRLQYQTSYKGSAKLVKRFSIRPVLDVYAEVVRQGDEYERWSDDEGQHYSYKAKKFNDGAIIGAFAVCKFMDGGVLIDEMNITELENTRSHSMAKNSMAWKEFTSEMYRKTVLRRLCKKIELDLNVLQREAYNEDEAIDIEEEKPEVVDVFEEEVEVVEVDGE